MIKHNGQIKMCSEVVLISETEKKPTCLETGLVLGCWKIEIKAMN
jgi:hypothetical protein